MYSHRNKGSRLRNYTKTELIKKIDSMDEAQSKMVLTKLIQGRTTQKFEAHLAKVFGFKAVHVGTCKVTAGKTIPINRMRDIEKSLIFKKLESLVLVILTSQKPLQTGRIISASMGDLNKGYKDESKISKADRVNAGYLLQMAEFEFVSVYDNERKMPVKVWKPKYGTAKLGYKERAKIAREQVHSEIEKFDDQFMADFSSHAMIRAEKEQSDYPELDKLIES
jgi:hypothetical protein